MKICGECKGRTCIVAVHEDMGVCPGEITLPVCPYKEEWAYPNWLTLVRVQNSECYDEEDESENAIEQMAEEVRKAIYTLEQGKPHKAVCEEMRLKLSLALSAYKEAL